MNNLKRAYFTLGLIPDCVELYLGGEGIEKLRGFGAFVNLEVLWINNNQLRCINGLDANSRIKELYAQVILCGQSMGWASFSPSLDKDEA
jgi:hypothetical protein